MTDMNTEQPQGMFVLTTQQPVQQQASTISSQSNGSFILNSPTNSGIKNGSPTLKKNKFEKLLGLYKRVLAQKQLLNTKNQNLETKISRYHELKKKHEENLSEGKSKNQEVQEKSRKIEQLRTILEEKKKQIFRSEEESKAQANSTMKQIMQIDSQIHETRKRQQGEELQRKQAEEQLQKKSKVISQLEAEFKFLEEKKKSFVTQIQTIKVQLNDQKVNFESRQSEGSFILGDCENQKQGLVQRLQSLTREISKISAQLEKIKGECSENNDEEEVNRIKGQLDKLKNEINEKKKQRNSIERDIEDVNKKIKYQEKGFEKNQKQVEKKRQRLKESSEKLQGLEQQFIKIQEEIQNIKSGKEKTAFIQIPPKYNELKTRNEHLLEDLKVIQDAYKVQKQQSDNLVPKHIIDDYKKRIKKTKEFYESNKNIKEKNEELEADIKNLQAEKDQLQWNVNPQIKRLQESYIKESQKIKQIEDGLKGLQKQSAQVTSKLEQYTKAYPNFQFERKKKKQATKQKEKEKQKVEKKVQQPKKAEDGKKKKKKKIADISPEPISKDEDKSQKSQKIEEPEIQEQVKEQKVAKKQNGQQEQKKKKKKKK